MPTRHADRLMPTLRRVVLGRQTAARSDGELLTAFVASADADAFGELVRRHGPMVLGVCRRLVPDHGTADDAFQATFLVLARRAAAVRPRERVGNYLYGIAYRTALKARTVLARRRSREKQVDAMPEPIAPPTAPSWADVQPIIDEELARLPEKLRTAVVLCDLEGRTQREVAKQLDVPPATLATRLASARRTLAARLTRRGVTLSGGALAGLLCTHASASAVPYALSADLATAAEAVASGGSAATLVSAQAVQLSEGVMQMMMLAKLKALAVLAAVALTLTTGLGVGLVPAAADDRPGVVEVTVTKPAAGKANRSAAQVKEKLESHPEADDAMFLRRLSLDVRGTVPTPVETWFFVSDQDDEKRAKVIEWIVDDEDQRAAVAKKLGVPVERVRVVRVDLAADGKYLALVESDLTAKFVESVAFSPDGKHIAVEGPGRVVIWDAVNEKVTPALAGKSNDTKPPTALKIGSSRLKANSNDGVVGVWVGSGDAKSGAQVVIDEKVINEVTFDFVVNAAADSDSEFLKRVLTDVRGNGPTALELKYFTEDKDPKKREKLLDTLLKEPAVQKKLGEEWKKKVLALKGGQLKTTDMFYYVLPLDKNGKSGQVPNPKGADFFYQVLPDGKVKDVVVPKLNVKPVVVPLQPGAPKPPLPPKPPVPPGAAQGKKVVVQVPPQTDKLEKLVGELLAAQKSDEALLEAITLATLSRLPTDAEKKIAQAVTGAVPDRKTAWVAVARALAGTEVKKDMTFRLKVSPAPEAPKK